MKDRILFSKDKLEQLYKSKELKVDLREVEYEYYLIIVGTLTYLAKDRTIFKKNKYFYAFIKEVFNIDFKEYVVKNKSILLGRILNYITNEIDKRDYEKYANILTKEINEIISPSEESYIKFLQGKRL